VARDYKGSVNPERATRPLPGWLIFITGLALGAFVTFLVFLKQFFPEPAPESGKVVDKSVSSAKQTPEVVNIEPAETEKKSPPKKPKFDFYTILPELEVMIPDNEISEPEKGTAKGKSNKTKPAKPSVSYILQAGSFKNYKEADRLKAELALLGIISSIQTVTIKDGDKWHRVRIGPITNVQDLNTIKKKLKENDINVILLKVKS
jgi:cell division protein FtsN